MAINYAAPPDPLNLAAKRPRAYPPYSINCGRITRRTLNFCRTVGGYRHGIHRGRVRVRLLRARSHLLEMAGHPDRRVGRYIARTQSVAAVAFRSWLADPAALDVHDQPLRFVRVAAGVPTSAWTRIHTIEFHAASVLQIRAPSDHAGFRDRFLGDSAYVGRTPRVFDCDHRVHPGRNPLGGTR